MSQPPDDLLDIFWVEAAEYLAALNQILLQLEVAAPGDDQRDQLREVSRIAHSLKGAARAVGQTAIETLAHQMEEVFDLTLAGALTLSPAVCDALYDSLDMIQLFASDEGADDATVAAVLGQLTALTQLEAEGHPRAAEADGKGTAATVKAGTPDERADRRGPQLIEPDLPPSPGDRPAAPVRAAKSPSIKDTLSLSPAGPRATADTVRVSLSKLDQLMGQARTC